MIRTPEPGLLAFFVRWPAKDETISSIFDRIGALYHMDRDALLASLISSCGYQPLNAYCIDWDNPPELVARVLERTLGLEPGALEDHRIVDGAAWLHHERRRSYCPACVRADIDSGSPPYFRRQWAKIHATICQVHMAPLQIWPLPVWTWHGRRLLSDWTSDDGKGSLCHQLSRWPGRPLAEALAGYEIEFSQAVEATGDPLIHPDARTRSAAKFILGAALFGYPGMTGGKGSNRRPRGKPIAGLLMATSGGWRLSSDGSETQIAAGPENGWNRFRRITHPGERRAAMLVAGIVLNWGLPLGSLESAGVQAKNASELRQRVLWPRTQLMRATWENLEGVPGSRRQH